jgi:hypothetical protein
MATKKQLLKEAQTAGLISEQAYEEEVTVEDLERLLGRAPVWEGSLSDHKTPPAPDGHDPNVNLLDA